MGCTIKRILQLKDAIQYQEISVFDSNKDITKDCLYSWSSDNICWTNWTSIDSYDKVCKNMDTDFYLRVLLNGGFDRISIGNKFTNCYNICIDSSTQFLEDFCGETNLFQPYNNLDCVLELQQQLSDSVVCMFGIPVFYFRVNPNHGATDYTFKEHFLHHVESVKQLKLMIPDGQMPSSNPKLTEFDFDWEVDWETEISKTQFAKVFGDTSYPKSGDFIYIPMMKRMWEVNAAYDEKNEGLMWRSTTWKLALIKYTDSTNVDSGSYNEIIDNWTQSYEESFGQYERNEQEREVGSLSVESPKFAATNLYNIFMGDAIRQQYSSDISILSKNYNHGGLVVARNLYKFKSETSCITYQKPICGDSGTIILIVETPGNLEGRSRKRVIEFGSIQLFITSNDQNKMSLEFNDMTHNIDPFKSYLVILKWNRMTFSSELNIYPYIHKENIPIYKIKPEMYRFDFENPICEIVSIYNNDYNMKKEMVCKIQSFPLSMTNIKYYNRYLDKEESIRESVKYTTQHENCIINDLARPVDTGHGYTVK